MPSFIAFAIAALATANTLALPSDSRGSFPVGRHSRYTVQGTNQVVNIFLPDYDTDIVQTFETSANFTPTVHYQRNADHRLVERDICVFVADCEGNAYQSLQVLATVAKMITADDCSAMASAINDDLLQGDDSLARQIISDGKILNFAINLDTGIHEFYDESNYFINLKLQATYGDSDTRNDVCGEQDPGVYSSNAASAVYRFCVSMITDRAENIAANYYVLDTHSGLGSKEGGLEGLAKLFISDQASTMGPTCKNYGVDW
ncbi:hypothetical protein GGS21DRAFT_543908 [Xylaria nigripes]|nr:hypothetical protein GGS21DRAFT_543908 [Xylaria nigripes]